ncbi:hypothetical protein C8F01DRAFT_1251786 [Mycena amicta]|nr:hypothetical protein C8F01DRAFT_1251786 [Mycena amicta]
MFLNGDLSLYSGKATRAAQRQQRHSRKPTRSPLGDVSSLPPLIRQHASFELPVDDPGFLDGYSADFCILHSRFKQWGRFPIHPAPPPDDRYLPDSAEYRNETRLIEAVLHGENRKQEQAYECELRERVADMDSKIRPQWLREEYEGALQSWRFCLAMWGKYDESGREHRIFMLYLRWKARRTVRLYHGIFQQAHSSLTAMSTKADSVPLPGKVKTPRAASTILARRAASARYREKNKEKLQAQARERMARRRQQTADDDESSEQSKRQARERSRAYRIRHAEEIAERKRAARARAYVQRYGMDRWAAREAQRHLRNAAIADDEALCKWDEAWAEQQKSSHLCREAAQSLLRVSRS